MTGVTIGSTHMNWKTLPGGTVDAFGVEWGLTKLDGWFDGWEGSGTVDQKSQADGAWVSPQYAGPRIVHVDGDIKAPSWDAATQAWDRLMAEFPFRQLATMRVSTGEGLVPEMTTLIRQHEKPVLADRFKGRATFSLSVIAPDPRRYSSTSQSLSLVLPFSTGGLSFPITFPIGFAVSSSVSQATLTNAGNIATYPTLAVIGPCPPARIANLTTGEARRVLDAVPAGQTLLLDELSGAATVQGQSRRVLGTPVSLRPGANEIAFSADDYDAAAQLLISYRSAWK